MIKETMTREERVNTALNLNYPDRVPVIPQIFQFCFRHKNLPVVPLAGGNSADWPKMRQALKDTVEDIGGMDGIIIPGIAWPISSWRINSNVGGKFITPGEDGTPPDFEVQYAEKETIRFEDYDTIINKGWNGFLKEYIPREIGRSIEQLDATEKFLLSISKEDANYWRARRYPVLCGALLVSCEMTLSLGRTLPKFMMDVHRHPDKVKAALEAMTPDFIQNNIQDMEASGIPWVVFSLERGSGAYFNLKTYEELFFPQLKKQVEAFAAGGYHCILHFDTNWTKNLPYLKELPAKSCICQFDSITNIFKAKEVLSNHFCIMGDVPASLLSLGNREEVVAYCEKLIDICGRGGGFILSSGCEVPPDAKFENVKAMIDTAKTHVAPVS